MRPYLPVRKLRAAHCDCTVEGFTTKLLEADTIVNLDSAYYYRIYRQTPAGLTRPRFIVAFFTASIFMGQAWVKAL